MARLNEQPLSTDNIEILRKKMLRQNRELAKINNVRALRIRELEGELSRALSENLQLRGRILELEKEAEDDDTRRIADQAMAIKKKLEAQLTEWSSLVSGLGTEPPMKRHSPQNRKTPRPRMSFSANRPSPSQRRLRDVARDVEELGNISENKAHPRRTMNPEQILALRSETEVAESKTSPDLSPPSAPIITEDEPVKVDTPPRDSSRARQFSSQLDSSPIAMPSPNAEKQKPSASPQKKAQPVPRAQETRVRPDSEPDTPIAPATKAGSKRKFGSRDGFENMTLEKITDENLPPRVLAEKTSILDKAHGKTLKELASMRKEARARPDPQKSARKPLSAKNTNTNDDMNSPKKQSRVTTDEVSAAKAKLQQDRPKPTKAKPAAPIKIETVVAKDNQPATATIEPSELPDTGEEHGLLSPSSPDPTDAAAVDDDDPRDTPPPADISSQGETSRASRRNRTAVSYAEPNLRAKMRRPTKELYDAVAGEGKSRRWSQSEPLDLLNLKRESVGENWEQPPSHGRVSELSREDTPESPLSGKNAGASEDTQEVVKPGRRRRQTSVPETTDMSTSLRKSAATNESQGSNAGTDADVYEFTSSSPRVSEGPESTSTRSSSRRTTASRRFSTTVDDAISTAPKERSGSRRRSMMV